MFFLLPDMIVIRIMKHVCTGTPAASKQSIGCEQECNQVDVIRCSRVLGMQSYGSYPLFFSVTIPNCRVNLSEGAH